MATKAKSTKYFKFQRYDDLTAAYVTIAEATNFKGLDEKADQLEATNFDSDGKEYIAGLTDGGEVSADLNFVASDSGQQGLRTDLRAGTLRNFKVIVNDHASDPTTVTFSAIVTTAPGLSGGVNAVIKTSVTLRVSGVPVWDYAPAV